MKIIPTGAADILLVEDLPADARSFDIEFNSALNNFQLYWLADFMGLRDVRQCRDLPEGYNYTILGRAKELTEEQCHLIARKQMDVYSFPMDFEYYNHNCARYDDKLSAIGSFHSFLKSQGILLENPYSDFECQNQWCEDGYIDEGYNYKQRCNYCQENRDLEEEAQSKVKNPLVIKAEKITPGE